MNLRRHGRLFPYLGVLLCLSEIGTCQFSPSEIFRKVRPSTVLIYGENESNKAAVQGSGFIIERNRIVTNYHVLSGTTAAYVVFADGESAEISRVVVDSQSKDLIVVEANTASRAPVLLGDELSLHEGDPVLALGAPEGLQFSITDGIVSGFRELDQQFLIQSTAPISHGSSGGPLLNRRAQVVGITSAMLSDSAGIYFSIGVNDLKRLLRTPKLLMIPFSQWAAVSSTTTENRMSEADLKKIQTLIEEKNYADAERKLNILAPTYSNDATFHLLMGRVEDGLGNLTDALKEFSKSIDINPKDASAHAQYAIALWEAKHFKEALVQIQTAKQINADTPDDLLAMLLYANGNYDDAMVAAKRSLTQDSKALLSLEVIAGVDYHKEPAGKLWRQDAARAGQVDKGSAWSLIAEALDELAAGRKDSGLADLDAAKKDGFPDPLPYLLSATVHTYAGDLEGAETDIKVGLTEMPEDVSLLSQGIFVALLRQQRQLADTRFASLQQRAFGSREEAGASCLYYYATNQALLAVAACKRSAELNPENRTAHSNLGWAALDANEFPLALDQYSHAVRLMDEKNVSTVQAIDLSWGMTLARYYSGDRDGARKIFQELKKDYPESVKVPYLRGLPLVWSDTTVTRIQQVVTDFSH